MIHRISVLILSLVLLASCGKEMPKSKPDFSKLPQKAEIPSPGVVNFISPAALLDSLSEGRKLPLYYLQDFASADSELMIPLPGMNVVNLGDATNVILKLPRTTTVYLVCNWGDDSKRMAKELAKDGYNCTYLDGGTYKLQQEIKRSGKRLPIM